MRNIVDKKHYCTINPSNFVNNIRNKEDIKNHEYKITQLIHKSKGLEYPDYKEKDINKLEDKWNPIINQFIKTNHNFSVSSKNFQKISEPLFDFNYFNEKYFSKNLKHKETPKLIEHSENFSGNIKDAQKNPKIDMPKKNEQLHPPCLHKCINLNTELLFKNKIDINPLYSIIPGLNKTKCSNRKNGSIFSYSAITHTGFVRYNNIRNVNEDRVSIFLNINCLKSKNAKTNPICSYFGLFDGHGGAGCAEFLRDNLHQYVI